MQLLSSAARLQVQLILPRYSMAGCGKHRGYMRLSFCKFSSLNALFQLSSCLRQGVCFAKEDEFMKQNHSAEAMIIYEGGCLPCVGRSRKVPLNARKVESITVRCRVQRTKIKATKKECFAAWGEESTYKGTYTGVTFRPLSEMPLINSSRCKRKPQLCHMTGWNDMGRTPCFSGMS